MSLLFKNRSFVLPEGWTKITTIDMHTGGEPLRVFVEGIPELQGKTVLEKRRYFRDNLDHFRTGLMWEPRGHADMYGAVVTSSEDADFDVFFLHNEGYSTMCGHAIIALTQLMYDTEMSKTNKLELLINVPCGKVKSSLKIDEFGAKNVIFQNVPSFIYLPDKQIYIDGIGNISFDIAFGGAFYVYLDAESIGLELDESNFNKIIDYGKRIKRGVMEQFEIKHPFEEDLSFLYGTIFVSSPKDPKNHSRNVCVFADGEVDRSPTGSGVAGRAAIHFAKGELRKNEKITIESIIGTTMTVEVKEEIQFGPYEAILPEVGGTAYITGRNEFYFDPEDVLNKGFIFR